MAPPIAKVLATIVTALTIRLFALLGPVIVGQAQSQDDGMKEENQEKIEDEEIHGKIVPVTLQWRKITCTLSDKAKKLVSFFEFIGNFARLRHCPQTVQLKEILGFSSK